MNNDDQPIEPDTKPVQLSDIKDISVNEKASVATKVIKGSSPKDVKKDDRTLTMKNCYIADQLNNCHIALWQDM